MTIQHPTQLCTWFEECSILPLKFHYHLHPLVEFQNSIVDQGVEENNSLKICKMTVDMDLINRKLLFFQVLLSAYQKHQMSISMVRKT